MISFQSVQGGLIKTIREAHAAGIDFSQYDDFIRSCRKLCDIVESNKSRNQNGCHITSGMPSGTVTDGECSDSAGADGAPAPAASGDDDDGGDGDGEPAPRPPHRFKTSRRVAAPLPCATAQPTVNLTTPPPPAALWRLPEVLRNVPVSRATLYSWIEQGRFPKPIKIGPRAVAWRSADVLALTV